MFTIHITFKSDFILLSASRIVSSTWLIKCTKIESITFPIRDCLLSSVRSNRKMNEKSIRNHAFGSFKDVFCLTSNNFTHMIHRNQWNDKTYERTETAQALIHIRHVKSKIEIATLELAESRLFSLQLIRIFFRIKFFAFRSVFCFVFFSCIESRLDHKIILFCNDSTYTSSIRSPFLMPAFSAAPLSKQADTCCSGAYNCPLMERNWPPSDIWPRTLKPKPVSVL